MTKRSRNGVVKFAVFAALFYVAIWGFVSLPDMLQGGERLVVALIAVLGAGVVTFGLALGFGFLFLYRRPNAT